MKVKATVLQQSLFSTIVMTEGCEFKRVRKLAAPIGTETMVEEEEDRPKKGLAMPARAAQLGGVLAVFLLLIAITPALGRLLPFADKVFAIIDVDINPSVSFAIDKNSQVLSFTSLNDDGKSLLEGLNFKGLPITDAIVLLAETARDREYNSSFVLISGAMSTDKGIEENDDKLQEVLFSIISSDKMKDFVVSSQAIKVSPAIRAVAQKNKITLARQAAFFYANRDDETVSLDEIRDYEPAKIFVILSNKPEQVDDPAEVIPPAKEEDKPIVVEPAPEPVPPTPEPPTPEPPAVTEPTPAKPDPAPTPSTTRKATISAKATDSGVQLNWNKTDGNNFTYYKIVLSRSNSSPSYPQDGYITYISDVNSTGYLVKPGAKYNGGDLGGSVQGGEQYYFSITAVYGDGSVKGNAVQVKMPGTAQAPPSTTNRKATVTAKATDNGVQLNWNKTDGNNFTYYKIVLSRSNNSPSYPQDGYITYISDVNSTSYLVKPGAKYNGGDLGGSVQGGEQYYFSVTAVYGDGSVKGNAVQVKMPGTAQEPPQEAIKLTSRESNGKLLLSWDTAAGDDFSYYKVVASQVNSQPTYPDDGYLYAVWSRNTTQMAVDYTLPEDGSFSRGSSHFGTDADLVSGQSYYFRVVAVYNDGKVNSNVLKLVVP